MKLPVLLKATTLATLGLSMISSLAWAVPPPTTTYQVNITDSANTETITGEISLLEGHIGTLVPTDFFAVFTDFTVTGSVTLGGGISIPLITCSPSGCGLTATDTAITETGSPGTFISFDDLFVLQFSPGAFSITIPNHGTTSFSVGEPSYVVAGTAAAVPEPSGVLLVGIGAVALGFGGRRLARRR